MADKINQEAIRYFREKKLKPSFSWKEVWGEEHGHAFTVAKSTGYDILEDVRGAIDDALSNGETFEMFQAKLEPVLRAKGWWGKKVTIDPKTGEKVVAQLGSPRRLKIIYNSNLRAARAAGLWERAQRNKKFSPYFIYQLGPSENHRPHHADKVDLILPIDDPFWDAWFPPNGWGCKCWVRTMTQSELVRSGGVSNAPDVPAKNFYNDRLRLTEAIPQGIDPGWHTSPGKARARYLANNLGGQLLNMAAPLAEKELKRLVTSPVFDDLVKVRHRNVLPVALLNEAVVQRLGGQSRVVLLSYQTAEKQKKNHPELSTEDYGVIDELLNTAEPHLTEAGRLIFVGKALDRWWRAVLKKTESGSETFLLSFHRKTEKAAREQLAKLKAKQRSER